MINILLALYKQLPLGKKLYYAAILLITIYVSIFFFSFFIFLFGALFLFSLASSLIARLLGKQSPKQMNNTIFKFYNVNTGKPERNKKDDEVDMIEINPKED